MTLSGSRLKCIRILPMEYPCTISSCLHYEQRSTDQTHQTSTILFPYPALLTKISTCVRCCSCTSLNIPAISSGTPTSTLWIEIRSWAASGLLFLISATTFAMAVWFVEYVRARWTPRAARSRAHAAPILDIW